MIATVILCVLSTLSFCACARGLITTFETVPVSGRRRGVSVRATRLARGYWKFALVTLAGASLVGAVSSYIELFS